MEGNDPGSPERKDVLKFGMTTSSYFQQWDNLHLTEGVLYQILRNKDGLHQYEQLISPADCQSAFVRLVHEQGHFGVDRTCEQLMQRAYWYGWKNTVKTELGYCADYAQYFGGKPPRQEGLQPMVCVTPWSRVVINITGKH